MRTGAIVFMAAALLAGCASPGEMRGGTRDILFVANVGDGTITLIDTNSLERLGSLNAIPDGKTPQDPAQAAQYPKLVASQGAIYAYGVKVSPDGSRVYVSRGYLGDVVALELATGKILWRFQTSSRRADHTALSPDGSRLFVSALSANEVQVIDTRTGQLAGSFATGNWPHGLSFTPDGSLLYVQFSDGDGFSEVDPLPARS